MRPSFPGFICVSLLMTGCIFDVQLGEIPETTPPTIPEPTAACVVLSPQSINFGELEVGNDAERTITLTNECEQAIGVAALTLQGDSAFVLKGASMEKSDGTSVELRGDAEVSFVPPGAAIRAMVVFQPSQSALARGELQFESPLNLPSVALTGNPAGPCLELEPSGINLGCNIIGTTSWRPVTLRNCGQVAAKVESLSWSDNSNELFALEDVKLPIVIAAGEEAEIAVGYSPIPGPPDIQPRWDTATLRLGTLGYTDDLTVPFRGFGKSFSCEGLRVVLVWVTPGDPDPKDRGPEAGSDMDLHLMHPFAVDFFDIPFDTYWYNANPQWGVIDDPSDDPMLSLDDYDSLGPETIVLPLPEDDLTYTVGVHYWSDHDFGPSRAQVQVSLFGELVYESPLVEMVSGELWEVGTITWPTGEIIPLANADGEPLVHTDFVAPCDVISCGK